MIANLLVVAGVALAAGFGAWQRLRLAAQGLVALVVAGAVAAALAGPLADGLFSASADPGSTWYYTADALCFWAVLCVVLLVLRTAWARLARRPAPLPKALDVAGGAVFGALAGYLAVGMALVILQMMPVAPAPLGYAPFRYVPGTSTQRPERAERGPALWLAPDRAAVWLCDAVAGGAAAEGGGPLLARAGDVYPPAPETVGTAGDGAVTVDDFLYWLWYRRWQAVRWRTGRALGPVPRVARGEAGRYGLRLRRNSQQVIYALKLQTYFTLRTQQVAGFPNLVPPEGRQFLQVRLRIDPVEWLPRLLDSAQFYLVDEAGARVAGDPMVYRDARQEAEGPVMVGSTAGPARVEPRNLVFTFPQGRPVGAYLASGMRFLFTDDRQFDTRTFIFIVPTALPTDRLRLFLDPRVPSVEEVTRKGWPLGRSPLEEAPPSGSPAGAGGAAPASGAGGGAPAPGTLTPGGSAPGTPTPGGSGPRGPATGGSGPPAPAPSSEAAPGS